MIAWRTCKTRYDPYDGTGAALQGGRWNSPGRAVVYAADSFAGSILEILAHSLRPRTLPGPHHAVRFDIPDELVEQLDEARLPSWFARDSDAACAFGDRWLSERRSVALVVPALPCRPVGRLLLINLGHTDAHLVARSTPFAVSWDKRKPLQAMRLYRLRQEPDTAIFGSDSPTRSGRQVRGGGRPQDLGGTDP